MGCLFVTGTDTGVGKTIFSLALLAALRARGVDAVAFKPVETGCASVPGSSNEWVGDDCRALARVTGQSPDQVAGRLYSLPAAPMVAAAERGETVDVDSLAADARALAAQLAMNAPLSVQACLEAMNGLLAAADAAGWQATEAALTRIRGSEDLAEGLRAFFEKRPPVFTGE